MTTAYKEISGFLIKKPAGWENQPRVPSGNPQGGEWGPTGGSFSPSGGGWSKPSTSGGGAATSSSGGESSEFKEKQREWEENLTPSQKGAIESWTKGNQAEIRKSYTSRNVPKWAKNRRKNLEEAMDNAPKFQGDVYRGMTALKSSNKFEHLLKVGAEVGLNGVVSTSKDIETAAAFLNKDPGFANVVLKIRSKSGVDISKVADKDYKWQREVVARHGTKYKVKSVSKKTVDDYGWLESMPPTQSAAEYTRSLGIKPRAKIDVHFVELEEI